MISATKICRLLVNTNFAGNAKLVSHKAVDGYPAYTSPWVASNCLGVEEETYGRKSFMYFTCNNGITARAVAYMLSKHGAKINWNWCAGQEHRFSIQISPIKGWHHWE